MRRPFNLARRLRPLLATVVLAAGLTATLVTVPATPSIAATPDCGAVTDWYIDLPATTEYYFVKTGGGWVSSFDGDGSDQFGTVDLSVSGASFHAYNPYLATYARGYTATFDGTLAANCTIGQSTPAGHWSSNHGSVGIFLASPFDQSAPKKHDISGTVTGLDGKPVAGAVIDVRDADGVVVASATTDSRGHYQTIDLAAGQYFVEPATDSDRYQPSVVQVNLSSSSATANFGPALGAEIAGSVKTPNGTPIPNAQIDISGPTNVLASTAANGSYGRVEVRPGHYTVTASYPLDGHQISLSVSQCAVGSLSGRSCEGHVAKAGQLKADFKFEPQLQVSLGPNTVAGNGRGVTDVTIRLTLDGQPVEGHLLNYVPVDHGAPPPTITSARQLEDLMAASEDYPLVGCVSQTPSEMADPNGKPDVSLSGHVTDGDGKINFILFVGSNDPSLPDSGFEGVGHSVGISVSDLLDDNPIPELPTATAVLEVTPFTFAPTPTPDELRELSTHSVPRPNLTGDEHANQVALLNWLVAVTHSEFTPTAGTDEDAIYFGEETQASGEYPGRPALDTPEAQLIFGRVLLGATLPRIEQLDLGGSTEIPRELRGHFYSEGIYPDPSTPDGRQLVGCVPDFDPLFNGSPGAPPQD